MHLNSTYVLAGGVALLIALANEKLRMALMVVDIIVILIAAADVFGLDLKVWR